MDVIIEVSNTLTVSNPSPEMIAWCNKHLVIPNPEYAKRVRMHKWVGNIPSKLYLYEQRGNTLVLPFGTLRNLPESITQDSYFLSTFGTPVEVDYGEDVPLYPYQEEAVESVLRAKYGILQSPAGSGKTHHSDNVQT